MAKSKGFKTQKAEAVVNIAFAEGHQLHGLEIVARRRVPVGVVLGATAGNIARALDPFIKAIVSWNLVDEQDNPLPVTAEVFGEELDAEEATAVLSAWVEAVAGVSSPLEQQSSATGS